MDIARDIRWGESVEKERDHLKTRRHEKRVESEGERRIREAWQAQSATISSWSAMN